MKALKETYKKCAVQLKKKLKGKKFSGKAYLKAIGNPYSVKT